MKLLVDSLSLPTDLQWISFALDSALWKMLYLVCKICKTSYNNYNFSHVMRYQSRHKQHQNIART